LSCLDLPSPVLSYPVMSCPVLSWFCHVFSFLYLILIYLALA
jgi:hypothetical protein